MGWIIDLVKELPLSAVLKERLADAEQRYARLEKDNATLQQKVTALEQENATLKQQVSDLTVSLQQKQAENDDLKKPKSGQTKLTRS